MHRLGGVAALVAAAALTGPFALLGTAPALGGPVADPRIFVLGDSVFLGAEAAFPAAFPGRPVTVQASVGQSLLGAPTVVGERRAEMGDTIVIGLGANDGTDAVEFARRIDVLMGALAGVEHVIWVNQAVFDPARAALNAEVAAARERWPSLHVIDWARRVARHPEFVYGDGLHLTPPGQQALADAVRAKVAALEAPPSTSRIGEIRDLILDLIRRMLAAR